MSAVRCPKCFIGFHPTRALTAARQLDDHLKSGRCIELRLRLSARLHIEEMIREAERANERTEKPT
jgi:hypothetical protein